ncbi:hypothetical protein, partial [Metallibacterium scheffleri]|uniref:hypothetical protein n=1 Tax=Metallibacterium scheffleri TaxID=993689 RepID=UPI003CCFE86D
WVIVRSPLVYGRGVKGNFRRLLVLAQTNFPLPFGHIGNKRSLVSVDNLCSFIECCMTHPLALREIFLVSDNQDLSTSQLVRLMRHVQGKRGWLFPLPDWVLKFFGAQLVDSLQVNIEKSVRLLNWHPPYTVETSLERILDK